MGGPLAPNCPALQSAFAANGADRGFAARAGSFSNPVNQVLDSSLASLTGDVEFSELLSAGFLGSRSGIPGRIGDAAAHIAEQPFLGFGFWQQRGD